MWYYYSWVLFLKGYLLYLRRHLSIGCKKPAKMLFSHNTYEYVLPWMTWGSFYGSKAWEGDSTTEDKNFEEVC
jgi:hypothetical protein